MWLERYRLSEHNTIVEAQRLAYKMRTLLARMNLRLLVCMEDFVKSGIGS